MNASVAILSFIASTRVFSGLQIVPPYPPNPVLLEGDPLTINCSAADSAGYPNVSFYKQVGADGMTYEEINKTSGRAYITYFTRNDTAKGLLTTTAVLHVTNANIPDDGNSKGMSYKCLSSTGLSTKELSFMVYVVRKIDLPKATVKDVTTPYGGPAQLKCDVTYTGNPSTVQLKRVVWIRNSKIIGQGSTDVAPITITKATTRDGGDYVCVAEVNLMATKTKKITMGTAKLNIKLKLFDGSTQVIGNVSGNAVMECPAEGYPLNVTWMRVNQDGRENRLSTVPRFRGRYTVSRPCPWCRYRLTIYTLQSRDQGHFVCKATSNMESARYHCKLVIPVDGNHTTATPTVEITPKKPSTVPWVSYILGVVILLSLLLNGWLIYTLIKRNNQPKCLEISDPIPIPPTNKDSLHDSMETIKELPQPADEESGPASMELQPLIANGSTDGIKESESKAASKESMVEPEVTEDGHEANGVQSNGDVPADQPSEKTPSEKTPDALVSDSCDCIYKTSTDPSAHSNTPQSRLFKTTNDPGQYCILS